MSMLALAISAVLATGCGTIMRLTSDGGEAISFANGELLSREPHSVKDLDIACERAIASIGYEDASAERGEKRVLWLARTAGGDRIEIRLTANGAKRSDLLIRVGVLGDETRSRLLLEHIHQSL